ncbi:ABC transporter ATP-binding protein [Salinactinospora qingdaonensis]|uniref:ABC transporter ATP-binding protein n=1 Tax=Salinactinospora qingdaonensis TaxID=702744 RepID=A0ABP7F6U6_9ACTN
MLRFFRRNKTRTEPKVDLPELAGSRYFPWVADLERMSFWRMAARLPSLMATALRWSWRASPRDTLVALVCNTAAGVLSGFVLVAITGVLHSLFANGPTPERIQAALPALLAAGAATVGRSALTSAAIWAQGRLSPQVDRVLQIELMTLVSQVKLESFDDSDYCDAIYRARDRGIFEARNMTDYTVDIITEIVGLVAVASVVTVLHPVLLPLLALTVLPAGWAAVRAARMRYTQLRRLSATNRHRYILGDMVSQRDAAAELRAYNMAPSLLAEYRRIASYVQQVMLAIVRRQTTTRATGDAVGGLVTLFTYLALLALLVQGLMPLAVAGAAYLALGRGKAALDRLVTAVNSCYEAGLYFADLLEACTESRRRTPAPAPNSLPSPLEQLTVTGVTFTYPGAQSPALNGVDLTLARGEVVALVGENGSGKTTLATLIAGLYTPQHGTIAWNGRDITTIDAHQLRERIATMRQDYTQWPFNARRNITMATDADTDPHRLQRALDLSGADEVIAGLDYGLDTLLDKRFAHGADLSGGQKQRIAAARGLYRQGDLLIADEPTAALDARAEKHLFDTLQAAAQGAAVLLITHRLASVRMADRIYVLEHGRVVENGTHDDLMGLDGLYAELYQLQADAYRAGGEALPQMSQPTQG